MIDWKALPRPIIALSPMADMTDSSFCQIVKSIASPIVFREMISSEALVRGNEKTLGMADFVPAERPIVQQLFGSDPATMAEAARIIEEKFAPDGLDVNMGCPVYKITCNFNGAALMKEPARATEIVRRMKAAVRAPVSVKIRLGWREKTEAIGFAKCLEDAGADLLTVHGRTKEQGYSGMSDWEMIGRVKAAVKIPVLANGDINTPEAARAALSMSRCDGVLIARGGLGNPWIFARMEAMLSGGRIPEEPALLERLRVLRAHAALHVAEYGPRGIVTFRKHISWYVKGIPGIRHFRERLHQVSSLEDLDTQLHTITVSLSDHLER
ncbi:tRNA dihydrouridine synthase DusB [Candidatus Uhrbacteria bacterium]|nr:tRNA dihydrouridine synthase DusB [Candidatus Uhrbacteria bacterium]